MKTVFSFFFLFLLTTSICQAKCRLSEKIVSLSGPVSMVLEELDLLGDPNLIALSKFHPIKGKTRATILAGGLFLSKKTLKTFGNSKIFFDKSRELRSILAKGPSKKLVEVDTRDQDPFEAYNLSLIKLMNSLQFCHREVESLNDKISNIKQGLEEKPSTMNGVFFLGEIGSKLPELIISNDGFVLFLRGQDSFKTYPSDLAYTAWSKKILNKLKSYKFFGIENGGLDNLEVQKLNKTYYNLKMRGVLVPGIRQIYFLREFHKLKFN